MRTCTRVDYMDGDFPEYYEVGQKNVILIELSPRTEEDPTPDTYDVHFEDNSYVTVYNVERAFFSADDGK